MPIGRAFVVRALSVLIALVVCAWFAVGIRQAHNTAKATAIVSGASHLSAARAEHAASLLHAAAFLNPDTEVDLLRAQLAVERGAGAQAQSIVSGVVRKEPMNVRAWFQVAANATNGFVYARALREISQLVPEVPSAR